MKSYRKELWFNIPSRRGFVNITSDVEIALRESGISEGLVLVNANPKPPDTCIGFAFNYRKNRIGMPHPLAASATKSTLIFSG